MRSVVEHTAVSGHAQFEQRVVQPNLVLERNEIAALLGGHGGGLGIKRVQAKIVVVSSVVEIAGVQNVFRSDVVLQTDQVVSGPLFESVGIRRESPDHPEGMLDADGIGKPEAPTH